VSRGCRANLQKHSIFETAKVAVAFIAKKYYFTTQQKIQDAIEMNMIKNITNRRAASEQTDASLRMAAKPAVSNVRRRALGDITNAYSGEETKENFMVKKPLVNLSQPTINEPIAPQVVSVRNAEDLQNDPRTYMQRPCDDIDSRDSDNPLLVTDYVNDMYVHFYEREKQYAVNPNYMFKQSLVSDKMRCILIDWLV
jgi:hypothetical protein